MEYIEGWMISLLISVVGLIAMIAVGRYKTEQNQKETETLKLATNRTLEGMGKKLDRATEELAEYKVRLHTAPSMEDVRKEFVSKEMFRQMEKHIDGKFDSLEGVLGKLLENQDRMMQELRTKG